ncbi:MAG: HDOD domain-containing protein [Bdellovibrionota bacterium]
MDLTIDSKLFNEFHSTVVAAVNLPITSRKIIEEFIDIDVTAEAVAKIIQRNQYFEYVLVKEIQSLGLKENTPTLRAAISLLGMQRVRSFVCALQIMRSVAGKYPEIDASGKLNFKPSEYLPFALKTEEYVSVHRTEYPDTCYAAAMLFDVLLALGRAKLENPKPFEEHISEVYKHGMRTAKIATEIAKTTKKLGFSKYIFSAGLLHDIGKVALDFLFPAGKPNAYANFRAEIAKKPTNREVTHFLEAKRFGLPHEYYSSQIAYFSGVFKDLEKPLLFHHDPYLAGSANKELAQFSHLLALATNIANNFRVPKDANDPIYDSWFTAEVKGFKVDKNTLHMTLLKMGRDSF